MSPSPPSRSISTAISKPRSTGRSIWSTTSALLDLVSEAWLERLAVEIAARALPFYAALSYDGRIAFTPPDPLDAAIVAAVNAHQRTDKGFGPALGPAAAGFAIARFEALGYSVVHGASDWVMGPHDRDIQTEMLAGWASAAREIGALSARRHHGLAHAPPRRGCRRTLLTPRRSRRFLRDADRHALSRQIAVEQHIVVDRDAHASACAAPDRRARAAAGSDRGRRRRG